MAAEYVCTLTDASLKKAKKELNENPKERDGTVETLRNWVSQQKHLTCDTDTKFLLRFLRVGKFSQLQARERLENYLKCFSKMPDWLRNIDTHDPQILKVVDTGMFFPMGMTKDGVLVMCNQAGKMDPDLKEYTKTDAIRCQMAFIVALMADENVTVNGMIFFADLSGFGMKHQMMWSIEDARKMTQIWQKGFPARYKHILYYNFNTFFEAVFHLFAPLLSKKLRDRIQMHSNLEKIYKILPKEMMPEEYLPDDYKGPNAGKIDEIVAKQKAWLMSPEVRERVLFETGDRFGYDESQKQDDIPQESFRKLNVD